ncbi:pilus assembly protein TadG-related protein [Rhizobium metallidurans]|uniref:Putative membrane protein n=1 Tax=Rhizobium metallidurans TaxID=1265931 RepID=A0A7W6CUE0_9HYPH|nr:pilus assembly protein TadG-related protein [Rhizobium metallidurans]MBB3966601.1 putative membrane protein [Rhizobium metallidurans]
MKAGVRRYLAGLCVRRDGNIAIMAALSAPLIISTLALGIDFGAMTLQQRRLQQLSDIGAIVAASDINNAAGNLVTNFQQNGLNVAVKSGVAYATSSGTKLLNAAQLGTFDAVVQYTPGIYLADPTVPPEQRFVAGTQPYDAVKVAIQQKAQLTFAAAIIPPPTLSATGTASASKLAAFSVGSRLASLNGGLLNAILGGLLGTTVSLKAVDYDALASANIDLLSYLDLLATRLNLTAGTYEELLATDISYPRLLDTLAATQGLTPSVSKAITSLSKGLGTTQIKVKLQNLLSLGSVGERMIGSGSHLLLEASALDIISASAFAANQGKQVGVNLAGTVPGLTSVTLKIAIGERPKGIASNAIGTTGSAVRTAQIRIAIEAGVTGLSAIAGIKLRVPLYVEAAYAEAKLANFACLGGGPKSASIGVDVVPGVAEIALGDVDPTAMANFGTKPRVTSATIIDALLLKVNALADINLTNTSKTRLTFQPNDITNKTIKNVSTRDTLTSAVQSLIAGTDIQIQLLVLTLGTNKAVMQAIADTLSSVTAPLDEVLYNTLLMLGIKIGEADVRFTDARCQQSVLVQ